MTQGFLRWQLSWKHPTHVYSCNRDMSRCETFIDCLCTWPITSCQDHQREIQGSNNAYPRLPGGRDVVGLCDDWLVFWLAAINGALFVLGIHTSLAQRPGSDWSMKKYTSPGAGAQGSFIIPDDGLTLMELAIPQMQLSSKLINQEYY